MSQPWAATCEVCEWSVTVDGGPDEAKIVAVLHVLDKHPLRYQLVTGKDPDVTKHEYREMLTKYRKVI